MVGAASRAAVDCDCCGRGGAGHYRAALAARARVRAERLKILSSFIYTYKPSGNCMSYIDKYLLSGETVAFRTRPHWIAGARPFFVMLVLLVIAGLGVALYGRSLNDPDAAQRLYWIAGAGGLALLLI